MSATITYKSESATCTEWQPGSFGPRWIIDEIPRKVGARAKYNGAGTATHRATIRLSGTTIANLLTAEKNWYDLYEQTSDGTLVYTHRNGTKNYVHCILAEPPRREGDMILGGTSPNQVISHITLTFVQLEAS